MFRKLRKFEKFLPTVRALRLKRVSPALLQICQRAVLAFQRGDWQTAERLCRKALGEKADYADVLSLLGIVLAQTGRAREASGYLARAAAASPGDASIRINLGNVLRELERHEEALACYDRALAIQPDNASAHLNRGVTLLELGRTEDALACCERALELNPDHAPGWNNRGNALQQAGRLEEALASYESAIRLQPDFADAFYNRGNTQKELARLPEAKSSYEQAILFRPDFDDASLNLGVTLQELNQLDDALAVFERAIKRNPRFAAALSNQGSLLQRMNRLEEALASHEQARAISPENAEFHYNRGNTLKALKRRDEALASYDRAISLSPAYAQAWLNRGVLLQEIWRLEEALACFDRAIELKPDYAEAWSNRGVALQESERLEESLASYETAIRSKPDYAQAHYHLALLSLSLCDFARGWEEFEWRWKTDEFSSRAFEALAPAWDGRQISGALLVRNEQGIGDEMFYAGMIGDLRGYAGSITVCIDPRLVALYQRSFKNIAFVTRKSLSREQSFDAEISMGSLGRYLRNGLEAFGNAGGAYLRADAERARSLRARLTRNCSLVCGVSWISKSAASGVNKSMRLPDLQPALNLPGFEFVDLQYGDTREERAELLAAHGLTLQKLEDIDNFNDIDGLAALIEACDVIVTVSNTTAHLAAAMGKPVLLMLPFSPGLLWYWHRERGDSLWYSSARLFRQDMMGDWQGVVRRVGETLQNFKKCRRFTPLPLDKSGQD